MTGDRRDLRARLVPDRRRTAGAAVVVVIAGLAVAVVVAAVGAGASAPRAVAPVTTETSPGFEIEPPAAEPPVLVHVLGEVREPGLFELGADARVLDAVAAAGGLTEAADPAGLNLARRVADGEQILVPAVGAGPPAAASPDGASSGEPVSLSTASVAELEQLPRIGPAIAERIVAWREAGGRFSSVDDLLEVEGIGPKIVEALRARVVP